MPGGACGRFHSRTVHLRNSGCHLFDIQCWGNKIEISKAVGIAINSYYKNSHSNKRNNSKAVEGKIIIIAIVQHSKARGSTILIVCVALSESDAASALLRLVVSTWFVIVSMGDRMSVSMAIRI